MKSKQIKTLSICKHIGLFLSMYLCVLLGVTLYKFGFVTYLCIMAAMFVLLYIVYRYTHKLSEMLFFYANLLISSTIGEKCVTQLYYANISSDQETLLVGDVFLGIIFGLTFISICSCVVVKAFDLREQKNMKSSS